MVKLASFRRYNILYIKSVFRNSKHFNSHAANTCPYCCDQRSRRSQCIAHRYAADVREAFDDGWHESVIHENGEASCLTTQVRFETAKSTLSHNQSPDMYFTQGLNPYRGCEHGCIYCYARPTHSYLGLSPGLDFETQIIAKRNLAEVLTRELQAKRYQPSAVTSYNSNFDTRMKFEGIWADLLAQRFRKTCERLGLNKLRRELDLSQFDPSKLSSQRILF